MKNLKSKARKRYALLSSIFIFALVSGILLFATVTIPTVAKQKETSLEMEIEMQTEAQNVENEVTRKFVSPVYKDTITNFHAWIATLVKEQVAAVAEAVDEDTEFDHGLSITSSDSLYPVAGTDGWMYIDCPYQTNSYFMGVHTITATGSYQYQWLQSHDWGYNDEGICVYDGRILVALADVFGEVGDYIDLMFADGTALRCIKMDEKNSNDPNATLYGHGTGAGTVNVIELIVSPDWYGGHSNKYYPNVIAFQNYTRSGLTVPSQTDIYHKTAEIEETSVSPVETTTEKETPKTESETETTTSEIIEETSEIIETSSETEPTLHETEPETSETEETTEEAEPVASEEQTTVTEP